MSPAAVARDTARALPRQGVISVVEGDIHDRILEGRAQSTGGALDARRLGRFQTALRKTPWGSQHQQTFALIAGDTLRASAERYWLTATIDNRVVPVCALGSFCRHAPPGDTDELADLVQALTDDAAASGAAMALLLPTRGMRAQWDGVVTLPTFDLTLHVTESPRHGAPMTTIRAGEERDLDAIVAMGRTRAEGVRFHLDRDVCFVRYVITRNRLLAGLGPIHGRQLLFFIAEEGITAAAYIVISVVGAEWMVEECGDRDPSGARVGALLQALIARDPDQPRPTIKASLPPRFLPPQVTIVAARPSVEAIGVKMLDAKEIGLGASDVLYWWSDRL